ncbi:MAG: hypothetical protein J5629_00135 [Muribaculaceae bacterium]|nr:hypothetical protein [Muribaculaceae bacterium]
MKKKIIIILLLLISLIGVFLLIDDNIYFGGKDVKGIYVDEGLRIATDNHWGINYCNLLDKAIDGDNKSIRELSLLDYSGDGEPAYDHGNVLVKLIDCIGEKKFISALGNNLSTKERNAIRGCLLVGLEYGDNKHIGQTINDAFPLVDIFLFTDD